MSAGCEGQTPRPLLEYAAPRRGAHLLARASARSPRARAASCGIATQLEVLLLIHFLGKPSRNPRQENTGFPGSIFWPLLPPQFAHEYL